MPAVGRVEPGQAECEGLAGPLGRRTFLSGDVAAWQARAFAGAGLGPAGATGPAEEVVAPANAVFSAPAVRSVLALGRREGKDLSAFPLLTSAAPLAALLGAAPRLRYLRAAGAPAAPSGGTDLGFDPKERALPGFALASGPLAVADAYVLPVSHWVQLLWANLFALGPFLWEELVGGGLGGAISLGWAALRALSVRPENLAARLNQLGPGASVHRNATVEGCVLGKGARIGAGAVVRGAVLGDDAVIEELALVEGAVLGRGARVQRLAMAKYSVLEEGCAFAGIMQLGVIGRGAVVKHGATLMDMTLGGEVRVRVAGALVTAPHGMCGVCVGDGAIVGSGVRIAPGRAIPAGLELLADPAQIVRRVDVPDGCRRVHVRDGALEPT